LACFQKALGHELPNQLVAARGLLRLLDLEQGDRLTPEGRDYLTRVGAAIERSHGLVAGLADIVRMARDLEAAQPVRLPELLQEIMVEMKRLFVDRTIAFEFDILFPIVHVPPRGFRQVLALLIRQAIQWGPKDSARIEIRSLAAPEGVEMRLSGHGTALAPEKQERLFDPFADGAGDVNDRLGLVMARAWAERRGGGLRFDAGPGRGNTFILRLPVAEGSRT
jgi:signal transduction histidine kinase